MMYRLDDYHSGKEGTAAIGAEFLEAVTSLTPWAFSQILHMLVDEDFAERACHRLIGWSKRALKFMAEFLEAPAGT